MTTTDALTWIVDTHLEVSRLYKLAIEREIQHTLRIFGGKLRDDVKTVLCKSITEIAVPEYPKPEDRETVSKVYHLVPKPNFKKIMAEYIETVNEL